jgi:hypothetical protein
MEVYKDITSRCPAHSELTKATWIRFRAMWDLRKKEVTSRSQSLDADVNTIAASFSSRCGCLRGFQ